MHKNTLKRLLPISIGRWTYPLCIGIDPLTVGEARENSASNSAHRFLAARYKERYDSEKDEIEKLKIALEYAQRDQRANEAPWIGKLRSMLIQKGTSQAMESYGQLDQTLLSTKGKRLPSTLVDIIERDQNVFRKVLSKAQGIPIDKVAVAVAEDLRISEDGVIEIYKEYSRLLKRYLEHSNGVPWSEIRPHLETYPDGRIGLSLTKKARRVLFGSQPREEKPYERMTEQKRDQYRKTIDDLRAATKEWGGLEGKRDSLKNFLADRDIRLSSFNGCPISIKTEEEFFDFLSVCLHNLRVLLGIQAGN